MNIADIDLQQFEPGFFFPRRFQEQWVQDKLKQYGVIQPREFYILDAHKLVYLSVPKAACSSIKTALAKAVGITLAPDQGIDAIHAHPAWHRQKGTLDAAQSGYAKFSFVRNPFDRLVSCYRDKINFTPTPQRPKSIYDYYLFALPTHSTFADFVERVSKIPDALADNHFKSQYALLYEDGAALVDTVGKFEQLHDDWQPIATQYQLDPQLEPFNVSKTKPGCHSDYRLYYTQPLVQLVYERYRQDVEMFGYEAEYKQLLEFVR